jgi:hypothetical protein
MKEILSTTPKLWEYLEDNSETGTENTKSVFTTWNMSYSLLMSSDSNSTAARDAGLLNCFAFLDEKEIDESIFVEYVRHVEDSQFPGWLREFTDGDDISWSRKKFSDTIIRFKSFSLISSFEERDGYLRISIHPLVKDWIRLYQSKEELRSNFELTAKFVCCWKIQPFWTFFDTDPSVALTAQFTPSLSNEQAFQAHAAVWFRNFEEIMNDSQPTFLHLKNFSRNVCVEYCYAVVDRSQPKSPIIL